jgi:H+-transporting ATPase
MGVDLKMVTGDELAIAVETAKQLGMGTNIMDANVLSTGDPGKKPLVDDTIERADGFAQVFPEHKYYVVDVLQRDGHIVGMTGDGVNDAPALKKADVGVAVSGATDAARAAADIVLMAPGLSVIVDAIKQSRQIFERMSNYSIYRIAETLRLLFFITICVITFDLYPVTTIMIVLLALLNDGAILTIAYDNVPVAAKPQKWDMRLILGVATTLGVVGVMETFGLFYLLEKVFDLPVGPDQKQAFIQTAIYLKLAVAGHLTVFVARTRGPWYKALPPAKIMLFAIFGTQLLAAVISVYGLFGMQAGCRQAYRCESFRS